MLVFTWLAEQEGDTEEDFPLCASHGGTGRECGVQEEASSRVSGTSWLPETPIGSW